MNKIIPEVIFNSALYYMPCYQASDIDVDIQDLGWMDGDSDWGVLWSNLKDVEALSALPAVWYSRPYHFFESHSFHTQNTKHRNIIRGNFCLLPLASLQLLLCRNRPVVDQLIDATWIWTMFFIDWHILD